MLDILLYSKILTFMGTLMIAFAALRVHHRVLNEHKIDKVVVKAMRRERKVGITGVALTIIGFALDIISFLY